jgi:hypothetical protein
MKFKIGDKVKCIKVPEDVTKELIGFTGIITNFNKIHDLPYTVTSYDNDDRLFKEEELSFLSKLEKALQ